MRSGRHDGITVAINAQLLEGSAGGIETNLLQLVRGLSLHNQPGDAQILIGPGGKSRWLDSHTGPSQSVVDWPPIRYAPVIMRGRLLELLRRLRDVQRDWIKSPSAANPSLRQLDQKLKDQKVELIHFPYQRYFPTSFPFIFEPWDLQHIHLPELFSQEEILFRNKLYSIAAKKAAVVVTATRTTKYDIVRHLEVPASRIAVIYRGASDLHAPSRDGASMDLTADERTSVREGPYAIYPAKPWPHKNHERLFAALAKLRRESGLCVPLVCTGRAVKGKEGFLEDLAEQYGIKDQIYCFGYLLENRILRYLATARLLIFPSLFEGLGIPLLEAMELGVPIACSNASCIPEVVGRAAVMFDPCSIDDIAAKLAHLWTDDTMRQELARRGHHRAADFAWERAVSSFRVLYRFVAKRELSGEDQLELQRMFS